MLIIPATCARFRSNSKQTLPALVSWSVFRQLTLVGTSWSSARLQDTNALCNLDSLAGVTVHTYQAAFQTRKTACSRGLGLLCRAVQQIYVTNSHQSACFFFAGPKKQTEGDEAAKGQPGAEQKTSRAGRKTQAVNYRESSKKLGAEQTLAVKEEAEAESEAAAIEELASGSGPFR